MSITVDTLSIYNRLKATGLSEESASAIAEVFREIIEENLANKNDLKTTESNLTIQMESIRAELQKQMGSIRAELEKQIAAVRAELEKQIALIRSDLEVVRAELEKKMEVLRSELKAEIAKSKASTIKWVAGMLVAQAALIATLVKLL